MNPSEIKILVVDDEEANIMLLSKVLLTGGFDNVMTTQDPTEVVSLHTEHNFDLIIVDINMPEMNGYEVLEALQKLDSFSDTKVIVSSADKPDESNAQGQKYAFDDYISKPMRIKEIMDIVNKALT